MLLGTGWRGTDHTTRIPTGSVWERWELWPWRSSAPRTSYCTHSLSLESQVRSSVLESSGKREYIFAPVPKASHTRVHGQSRSPSEASAASLTSAVQPVEVCRVVQPATAALRLWRLRVGGRVTSLPLTRGTLPEQSCRVSPNWRLSSALSLCTLVSGE